MIASASRLCISHVLPSVVFFLASALVAQSALAHPAEPSTTEMLSSLPDSPGALYSSSLANDSAASQAGQPFSHASQPHKMGTRPATLPPPPPRVKFIASGRSALPQRAQDKVLLGLRETLAPSGIAGWFFSSGWSHLLDNAPNYGVDSSAYAQRLGAAAALGSSKEIFSDALMAPVLHQDPRYYQLGHGHRFINRAAYAATRPIIGRTDAGRAIPNYAYMLGTAEAAALAQAYYPERNRNGVQVARTWITSLGGSALGDVVSEFSGDMLQWLHLTKHE